MAFEILDKVIYKTTHYLVIGDNGVEYSVKCSEDDFLDYWSIWTDEDGDIEPESELGSELIRFCMNHEDEN